MDDYEEYPDFGGKVLDTASALRNLLKKGGLGDFRLAIAEDERSEGLRSKIETLFGTAEATDEILFYFAGHGKLVDGHLYLLPVNTKDENFQEAAYPARALAEQMVSSRARAISVVLDCCDSPSFLNCFGNVGDLDSFPISNRSIQILCSRADATVKKNGPQFSQNVINGILLGTITGKPNITLKDVASYLASLQNIDTDLGKHFLALNPKEMDLAGLHVLCANRHRSHGLPNKYIRDLFSGDQGRGKNAAFALAGIADNPDHHEDLRAKARTALIHFGQTGIDFGHDVRQLTSGYLHGHEDDARKPADNLIHILFNTRNYPFAEAVQACLHHYDIRTSLTDLETEKPWKESPTVNWISTDQPSIWIVDDELIRLIAIRLPEVAACLADTPASAAMNRAVYWRETDKDRPISHPLFRAARNGDPANSIEQLVYEFIRSLFPDREDVVAPRPHDDLHSRETIVKSEDYFLSIVEEMEKYNDGQQNVARAFKRTPHVLEEAPREPRFLIFRRAGEYVMAIVDVGASVNEYSLQRTFEPQVHARLADVKELESLGFSGAHVDPMWYDPAGRITRILVDANIFFQFLMFPVSRVMLPKYHHGAEEKIYPSISSFIRTLLRFHGDKVVFANLTTDKGFKDRTLISLISQLHGFSRFAPTPSNSLHIGSLRTALISYMFSLNDKARGRFHIRFDDTNVKKAVAQYNIDQILQDLRWIGFPQETLSSHYRQSSEEASARYNLALSLFADSGLVCPSEDGALELSSSLFDMSMGAYWLDLRRGPRVLHEPPRLSSSGNPLDYSMTWPQDESDPSTRFKYKFAGAVDDMIHNSIVVRDVRQEDSAFTARQSIIMSVLRDIINFPRSENASGQITQLREAGRSRLVNRNQGRPFPFACPPTYFHVSRVTDQEGGQLSKRLLKPEHSVSYLRKSGNYFPETILIWCLLSLGWRFCNSLGYPDRDALIYAVAAAGPEAFLEELKGRVSPVALWQSEQNHSIRISGLGSIDHKVMKYIPPARLVSFARALYVENSLGHELPPELLKMLRMLYGRREWFAGAGEISKLILWHAGLRYTPIPEDLAIPDIVPPLSESHIESWVNERTAAELPWVRFRLSGMTQGAPVSELISIAGLRHAFECLSEQE